MAKKKIDQGALDKQAQVVKDKATEDKQAQVVKDKATDRVNIRKAQAADRAVQNQKNLTPFVDLNRGDSLA